MSCGGRMRSRGRLLRIPPTQTLTAGPGYGHPSSMLTERDRGQPICGELPLTRSGDLPARTPVSYPPYRQRTGASPPATPAVLGCTVGGEGLLGRIAGFRSNPPAANPDSLILGGARCQVPGARCQVPGARCRWSLVTGQCWRSMLIVSSQAWFHHRPGESTSEFCRLSPCGRDSCAAHQGSSTLKNPRSEVPAPPASREVALQVLKNWG